MCWPADRVVVPVSKKALKVTYLNKEVSAF